ncbi:hypothetical protein FQR65_LT04276 [Abscondita terminalis]|nr:hypothetical protein FQR65_LT04276 [Abscondita terminalis]
MELKTPVLHSKMWPFVTEKELGIADSKLGLLDSADVSSLSPNAKFCYCEVPKIEVMEDSISAKNGASSSGSSQSTELFYTMSDRLVPNAVFLDDCNDDSQFYTVQRTMKNFTPFQVGG